MAPLLARLGVGRSGFGFGKRKVGDPPRLITFSLTLDGSPGGAAGGRTVMSVTTLNTNTPQLYVRVANGSSGYNNGGAGGNGQGSGGGSSALYWSTSPNWLVVVGGGGGGGNCGGTDGGGGVGAGGAAYECTDPGNSAPTGGGGSVGAATAGANGSTADPGGGGGGGAGASGGGGGQPYGGDNPGPTRDLATGGGGGAGNMRATGGPAAPYAPEVSITLTSGSPGGAGPSAQRCIIVYNGITYNFAAGTIAPLGNMPTPIPW